MEVDIILVVDAFIRWNDNILVGTMGDVKEKEFVEREIEKIPKTPQDLAGIIIQNIAMLSQVGVFEGIRILKINIILMKLYNPNFEMPKEPSMKECKNKFFREQDLKWIDPTGINDPLNDKLIDYQAQIYRDMLLEAQTKLLGIMKKKNIFDIGRIKSSMKLFSVKDGT